MPDFMDGNQWYQYRFLKFLSPVGGDNNWQPQTPFQMLPQSNGVGQALIQQLDNDLTSPYILKQMLADGATTDWPDLVTGNGHQQNHFVSVSGASETASYHFGLGYNDEKGIYEGDGKTTYSFKGSVDAKITSWFSAGINFNLSKINNSYASDDAISQAYRVNPFMIPYTEDGEIQHFPGNKATLGTNGNQFSDFINPMDRMRNESHKRKSFRALGNIYAQFTIIPGLVFKSTFMPDYENYRDGVYVGYTNPKTGQTYVDNDVRYAQVINNTEYGWTWDNMLTFDRTFGEHGINIMALYSAEIISGDLQALSRAQTGGTWGQVNMMPRNPNLRTKCTAFSHGHSAQTTTSWVVTSSRPQSVGMVLHDSERAINGAASPRWQQLGVSPKKNSCR